MQPGITTTVPPTQVMPTSMSELEELVRAILTLIAWLISTIIEFFVDLWIKTLEQFTESEIYKNSRKFSLKHFTNI